MQANELRGEVDLPLDGCNFVLRPSYEAVVACEKKLGRGIIQLAIAADDGSMSLADAATIAGEFIRAWGQEGGPDASPEQRTAAKANDSRIGSLIYDFGLMATLPRLAIVLSRAASGGVDSAGKQKAATGTMTTETLDAAQPA